MNKTKVLLVDDDLALGSIVTLALEDAGYKVHYQTSLAGIRTVTAEMQPDIVVLDVEIGAGNGIDAIPELKQTAPEVPVLVISSHVESDNVVKALEVGALTYLKKPFEITELLAYIQRFAHPCCPKGIEIGMFCLKADENLLLKGDEKIRKLSLLESKLLKMLAHNPNRVTTREEIEKELWGEHTTESSKQSLNNYIARIRKYLADDCRIRLITIPRIGYKLITDEEQKE